MEPIKGWHIMFCKKLAEFFFADYKLVNIAVINEKIKSHEKNYSIIGDQALLQMMLWMKG
ncbi:MAG: hypothetical protein PF489_09735 [Salinivirgaceae bacterium]|nr:hypothetical protein [Salinivirgaceae bacterium]